METDQQPVIFINWVFPLDCSNVRLCCDARCYLFCFCLNLTLYNCCFVLQALMLESLQRTSTSHPGLQPNSQVRTICHRNDLVSKVCVLVVCFFVLFICFLLFKCIRCMQICKALLNMKLRIASAAPCTCIFADCLIHHGVSTEMSCLCGWAFACKELLELKTVVL